MRSHANLLFVVILVLVAHGRLLAAVTVINDGTTTTNLGKLSNFNGSAGAVTTLESSTGVLIASQSAFTADFALRTVWFPTSRYVSSNDYTVTADFMPAAPTLRNRGGVMGWLDLSAARGIGLQVSPSDDPAVASFQVTAVDFTAGDDSANESVDHLFNLDGTPATSDLSSAMSDVGNYVPTSFATFQLEFSTPTAADQTALTNKATTHITAKVFQGGSQVGRTIELLTDLPPPTGPDHRFGYYAFWGSVFSEGSTIGQLDNLSIQGALGEASNIPPTVTLTSPANGDAFNVPVDITLTANALDRDGTVTRVDFFAGTKLIGTSPSTSNPYDLLWTNVPPGTHLLMATAFDNAGASRVSTNQVTITVSNSPPSIVVTSPQDGATFTAPATITIIADATDIDGTVTYVDFLDGANFLGSSTNTAAPYTFTWSNVPAGSYSLRAQATDEWNAFTISTNQVNVTVTGGQPGTGPSLTIVHTNNSVVISWPASFVGFRLQSKTSLSVPAWSDEPAANNMATVTVTGPAKFFRLVKP